MPSILHAAFDSFNFSIPLHSAMWALFLVAFFTFLRKSNLVPDNLRQISPKVITQANLVFTSSGANIHVSATKTIQCQQRFLVLPIPSLPGSHLCPISALRHHLSLNPGPGRAPLFTVSLQSCLQPFCSFLSCEVSRLHLDPSHFSPHSFRRGGATFAFDCHIPFEIIKLQGDCQSDAYLVYLELSQQQKQCVCHAMADNVLTRSCEQLKFVLAILDLEKCPVNGGGEEFNTTGKDYLQNSPPPGHKDLLCPGGCLGGGEMVTVGIEPCITL